MTWSDTGKEFGAEVADTMSAMANEKNEMEELKLMNVTKKKIKEANGIIMHMASWISNKS